MSIEKNAVSYDGAISDLSSSNPPNHSPDARCHEVRSVFQQIVLEHRRRYGYRRVTVELRRRGIVVNHKRLHSALGYRPHEEFEQNAKQIGETKFIASAVALLPESTRSSSTGLFGEGTQTPSLPQTHPCSENQGIFRKLFRGRTDVYPLYGLWRN